MIGLTVGLALLLIFVLTLFICCLVSLQQERKSCRDWRDQYYRTNRQLLAAQEQLEEFESCNAATVKDLTAINDACVKELAAGNEAAVREITASNERALGELRADDQAHQERLDEVIYLQGLLAKLNTDRNRALEMSAALQEWRQEHWENAVASAICGALPEGEARASLLIALKEDYDKETERLLQVTEPITGLCGGKMLRKPAPDNPPVDTE